MLRETRKLKLETNTGFFKKIWNRNLINENYSEESSNVKYEDIISYYDEETNSTTESRFKSKFVYNILTNLSISDSEDISYRNFKSELNETYQTIGINTQMKYELFDYEERVYNNKGKEYIGDKKYNVDDIGYLRTFFGDKFISNVDFDTFITYMSKFVTRGDNYVNMIKDMATKLNILVVVVDQLDNKLYTNYIHNTKYNDIRIIQDNISFLPGKNAELIGNDDFVNSQELINEGKFVIRNYQTYPIYKMINENLRGLLLWYNMGTGKTVIGMELFYNFRNKGYKFIVACPKYVTFSWVRERKKLLKINDEMDFDIEYIKIEDIENIENPEKSIVIVDECHHIFDIENKVGLIKSLLQTEKVLFLSGTPYKKNYVDLGLFEYICNRENSIKIFNREDLMNKYGTFNRMEAFMHTDVSYLLSWFPITIGPLISGVGNYYKLMYKYSRNIVDYYKGTVSQIIGLINPILINLFNYLVLYKTHKIDFMSLKNNDYFDDLSKYILRYNGGSNSMPTVEKKYMEVSYTAKEDIECYNIVNKRLDLDTANKLINDELNSINDLINYADDINTPAIKVGNQVNGNKFKNVYETAKNHRAVFYSSFYEGGSKNFMRFLKKKKEPYIFLDINDNFDTLTEKLNIFAEKDIFLILHPDFTESISIKGAQQLHILDPPINIDVTRQVEARVVRYDSHIHLPRDERHVNIYYWYCTYSLKGALILAEEYNRLDGYNKWRENSSTTTPDKMYIDIYKFSHKGITDLENYMDSLTLSNIKDMKIKCCIDYIDPKQDEICSRKYGKC